MTCFIEYQRLVAWLLLLAPCRAGVEAIYAPLAIGDIPDYLVINDGTVSVRNVMASSDRPCYALHKNSMTASLPDRAIVLGTGGEPFGETTALVRREDTGEYYPEPSSELQGFSDEGIGASHKTCGFQFEFLCDGGNRIKFEYVLDDDYLFMVSLNRQCKDLNRDDNDWYGDVIQGWNKIEFTIGSGGDDDVDSRAFLEAGLFSCMGSADVFSQPNADANDDETDMVLRSSIPPEAVVVVAILLLMVASCMMIYVAFDYHQRTRDENSSDSPTAALDAASSDKSPSGTTITIVSPIVSPTIVWYYPYTWWYYR